MRSFSSDESGSVVWYPGSGDVIFLRGLDGKGNFAVQCSVDGELTMISWEQWSYENEMNIIRRREREFLHDFRSFCRPAHSNGWVISPSGILREADREIPFNGGRWLDWNRVERDEVAFSWCFDKGLDAVSIEKLPVGGVLNGQMRAADSISRGIGRPGLFRQYLKHFAAA